MGRSPCCEKTGLKRGPWTVEEDEVLISHVQKHGHSNWRALPKQAGLLRCGKSCRLRWTNYLRPDIKRGNFTGEEEDAIIKLQSLLGNRWLIIASKLPGRTDNEIKNVWHTHLKKRSNFHSVKPAKIIKSEKIDHSSLESASPRPSSSWETHSSFESRQTGIMKPIALISRTSSIESSWAENCDQTFGLAEEIQVEIPSGYHDGPKHDDCMDFWYSLFCKTGGFPDLNFETF